MGQSQAIACEAHAFCEVGRWNRLAPAKGPWRESEVVPQNLPFSNGAPVCGACNLQSRTLPPQTQEFQGNLATKLRTKTDDRIAGMWSKPWIQPLRSKHLTFQTIQRGIHHLWCNIANLSRAFPVSKDFLWLCACMLVAQPIYGAVYETNTSVQSFQNKRTERHSNNAGISPWLWLSNLQDGAIEQNVAMASPRW